MSSTPAPPAVTALKGVGPALAAKLATLGIRSVADVLFHLPLRYQDRTRITPIAALRPGQQAVIEGVIRGSDVVFGRRRALLCRLQDGSGTISLRFFHFSKAQQAGLKTGDRLRCFGEARRGPAGLELVHPEYRHVSNEATTPQDTTLTPIYPSTDGFSQLQWQRLSGQALAWLQANRLPDPLPARWLPPALRVSLADALHYLHRPPASADQARLVTGQHPFQQRLAFEELLAHQLSLLHLRRDIQRRTAAPLHRRQRRAALLQALPFQLTAAQQRALAEIDRDLARDRPMLRLLQGDVGSGKTVVAALAALSAIDSGFQAAVMAPTEILAEQHQRAFQQWLAPLGIETALLTGRQRASTRRPVLQGLADGSLPLVVGTHAVFQPDVQYQRLGLVIIDEQHRFGVQQRLNLAEKSGSDRVPHQLIMTATPIPRTLAMSAYADLDTTVIDALPPGRQPITTVVIDGQRRDSVIARIHEACRQGRQAYWVCTLIEESDELDAEAAEATAEHLADALPDLRIGLLHGRLSSADKAAVMQAFQQGDTDLLVATTVIEVGVDVPNASLMVIENPERLGLAQLHQLRGRVGRGSAQSHCVLLYGSPLSAQARERLQVLRDSNDGFVIAEKDLALRGPGELLGRRQAGLVQFRIADLQRDAALLDAVRDAAQALQHDTALAHALMQRWLPEADRFVRA